MTTYISYKTAKMLKEFLGEGAPEPMDDINWWINDEITNIPKYSLHDLLSRPFCEALARKNKVMVKEWGMETTAKDHVGFSIAESYYNGGFPAVEKELLKIIGEER